MSGAARLILASASPRRRELLASLGLTFEVVPSDADETLEPIALPEAVAALALRKARAVAAARRTGLIVAADTIVVIDGRALGKPADRAEARSMLQTLRGRTHEVISGLALICGQEQRSAIARTAVSFRELDEAMLRWYLATGEWRGRAGAYAIQGAGAALVRALEGDYENVVGLPVAALLDLCPQLLR